MITFKQYLTEARMAPLYHGTSVANALKILSQNVMRAGSTPGDPYAISFTRNLKFAFDHSELVHTPYKGKAVTAVLQFDQQKLNYNYKLEPYNFFSQKQREAMRIDKARPSKADAEKMGDPEIRPEFEERIVGNKPIYEVKKYITKIIILKKMSKRMTEKQLKALKDFGIKVEII